MAGLGLLFLGIMTCGSAIGCAIDNKKAKNHSYKIDEQGRPTWIDRKGDLYINGERTAPKYDYKNNKSVTVGVKTGTVYFDPEQNYLNREREWDEKRKQQNLGFGKKAYMKYVPELNRQITCEASTGKFIAELDRELVGDKWEYRKYYLDIDAIKPLNPISYLPYTCAPRHPINHRMPGDKGIVISKEEFIALNIWEGSHGGTYCANYSADKI